MYILGISAFYHDSAACLVKDGDIIAAAQEERFTRKKHDQAFPDNAVQYCLEEAGIASSELDYVGFYEKPFRKFDRILETYIQVAPKGIKSFLKAMPLWLKDKIWMSDHIKRKLDYDGKIIFTEHHESHAASAFFPSPFEEAAILTVDGVGEWTSTSRGAGTGNKIELFEEIRFPHSLGLLYSAFTYYLGFKVNSGEYKLMGLAPYGQPKYVNLIKEKLINLREDGSFRINLECFDYLSGLRMTNEKFDALFGDPPRKPEDSITERHVDIARSIQAVIEEALIRIVNSLYAQTGLPNLCMAGGVALNCVANARVLRETSFKNIFVQPAAGDAGGSLGTALFIWHQYLENGRETNGKDDRMKGALLGPKYSSEEISAFLNENGISHTAYEREDLLTTLARMIAEGNVIGFFQGRMEFGPRALGCRSILADPRNPQMQSLLNLKIKFRESFRPFAPSVLLEEAAQCFDFSGESPYMLLTAPVKEEIRMLFSEPENGRGGIDRIDEVRSTIPAVTHVDFSARLQTVNRNDNPFFYNLINEFYKLTGCPVLINTSFNVRGEPIVCSLLDAFRCFIRTKMDCLVLENFIIDKKGQMSLGDTSPKQEFEPD
jgi:carbamoyltransferase